MYLCLNPKYQIMKKIFAFAGIAFVTILFLALALRPVSVSGSVKFAGGNPEFPDSVAKVVQKCCLDCHGENGEGMAKAHVNMSNWNSYDTKKQASKAASMSKKLSKGAMPPEKWRKNNPDIVPTEADVNLIKNWAAALNK